MFIGINDIWDSFDVAADANNQTTCASSILFHLNLVEVYSRIHAVLIARYMQLAGELYTAGARRFLFLNVPTIEKTPFSLALTASEQAFQKIQVADFNSQLSSAVTS